MKVIICTTFREFNGNSNDSIQRLFIDSLKAQSFKDWELVATTYKEKNVGKALKEMKVPHVIYESDLKDCRFSLTEVLVNGAEVARNNAADLIIWTTCDVIFEDNFLETIIKEYKPGIVGTSHPHLIAETIGDFNKGNVTGALNEGFDTLYFDSKILTEKTAAEDIKKYFFKDWGIFEHFLIAFGTFYGSRLVNVWSKSKIYKISNDRTVNLETNDYLRDSWNKNNPILQKFIKDKNLNDKFSDLIYCHTRFKALQPAELHTSYWHEYLAYYYSSWRLSIRSKLKSVYVRLYDKK